MQKISTNLWFDGNAEEAANFYTSTFKNSNIGTTTHFSEVGQEIHGMEPGSVMTIEFEVEGYQFVGLNGGPLFTFTPAVSFLVNCENKEEVDELWGKLSEGGKALMELDKYPFSERYGWTEDKFGISWQVSVAQGPITQKIVPSLMFVGDKVGKAEEAISFYTSVFKNAKAGTVFRRTEDQGPDKAGSIAYADFMLEGQTFAAMESAQSHDFDFSEATSFIINCNDQEEVDYYWEKLSAVPESEQCGWLKDKYGVSWQVTPTILNELTNDQTSEQGKRAMQAMLKMKKIDIEALKAAYEGR